MKINRGLKSMTIETHNLTLSLDLIAQLARGEYDLARWDLPEDELGRALHHLAHTLADQHQEQCLIDRITAQINAGLLLDDILDNVYRDFHELIPYSRMGLSLIAADGETVESRWIKSDYPRKLGTDYRAPLTGSSLKSILNTGQPRILNDLEAYLHEHPHSVSTRLLVAEGIRSSLTCPLTVNGDPVGFLFFSSREPYTYADAHVESYQRIAAQLAVIIEKGRLASELAAQKNAIDQRNTELQELNELKNTFLSIAAHDLRSPLGVIEMAMGILGDPQMDLTRDEYHTILDNIQAQTHHMTNLIDNLLDFSVIESGQIELLPKTIMLDEFLARMAHDHRQLAVPKGTSVYLAAAPETNTTIMADPGRLRQVMDNLISNAVKYAPPGSTVTLYAEPIPDGWRIAIKDEGPGISLEDRARLFQPFERLAAQPTGGENSTGLGLAISRHLVEAHGGTIGVDSEPGQGATFWFTLPTQPPAQRAE